MAICAPGRVSKHLQTLFTSGPAGDLADGALLERFLATRDDASFEVLVARHGPMVLRVCHATLADPVEADDAFQVVFLILVREAATIRSRDSVASWLHGVACRVSARAKVDAARRRKHRLGIEKPTARPLPSTRSFRDFPTATARQSSFAISKTKLATKQRGGSGARWGLSRPGSPARAGF